MVTVGSQSTVVSGVNATINYNGNQYAVVKTFKITFRQRMLEDKVAFIDIPIVSSAELHGDGTMEVIYSTEDTAAMEQLSLGVIPVRGAIQPITLITTASDVSGHTITNTYSVYPESVKWSANGPTVTMATVDFIIPSMGLISSGGSGPPGAGGGGYLVTSGAGGGLGYIIPGPAVNSSGVRMSFYAAGLIWLFYISNSGTLEGYLLYSTAPLVASPTFSTPAIALNMAEQYSPIYSISFDGTYFYAAYDTTENGGVSYELRFRRGTPNPDGSITWSNLVQLVDGSFMGGPPMVATDSNGHPWIQTYGSKVYASSTSDGTWLSASGFPVSSTYDLIAPLSSLKMALASVGGSIQTWSGSSAIGGAGVPDIAPGAPMQIVSVGDTVYAFMNGGPALYLNWYNGDTFTWQPTSLLVDNVGTPGRPYSMSYDANTNKLFLIYPNSSVSPTGLVYRKFNKIGRASCRERVYVLV